MKATIELVDHWQAIRFSSRRLVVIVTFSPPCEWSRGRSWRYSAETWGWWAGRVFGPVEVLTPCEIDATTPVPLKWKVRWFLQGMASVFGYRADVDAEVKACTDEMMQRHHFVDANK